MTSVAPAFEPKIGGLVNVAPRTWPGINKLGGVGVVTNVSHDEELGTLVDVKYVLGGEEKVELEYVEEHSFDDDKTSRRKRSAPTPFVQEDVNVSAKKKKKKKPLKDSTLKKTSQANSAVDKKKKQNPKVVKTEKPKVQSAEKNDNKSDMAEAPGSAKGVSSFLKNVYSGMTSKASSFVQEIVGGKMSEPSSPDSCGSLEIKIRDERETRFNNVFSEIMRREMAESIEISDLLDKVNTVCLNDKFTALELRSNLQRLDAENRVMVTWESGTVYMI
jgi:hypothetical protein